MPFFTSLKALARFSPDGPQANQLLESEKLTVVVVGLEPRQRLPAHPAPAAMYHVLEGEGWITVDDERHVVGPGNVVIAPEGARRGVEAKSRMVLVGVRAG